VDLPLKSSVGIMTALDESGCAVPNENIPLKNQKQKMVTHGNNN